MVMVSVVRWACPYIGDGFGQGGGSDKTSLPYL